MRAPKCKWIGSDSGLILVLTMIAFLLFPSVALADGMEDARRRGRLIVGVRTDFPPFGFVNDRGEISGFDAEIARYLAQAMFDDASRVDLVKVTGGSRISYLYSGWVDLIIAATTVTDERTRVLEFSEPYFLSGSLLLVEQDSRIRGLPDLIGKSVGVVEGAIQAEDLRQVVPGAVQTAFRSMEEAVSALKTGAVEAFCQDDVLVVSLALKDPELKSVGRPFLPRPYAVAARKSEAVFIRWVDTQLDRMRNDGTYGRLWQQYFGDMQKHLVIP